MKKFVILHEFEDTQCLIEKVLHGADEGDFEISLKFWSITGNCIMKLSFGFDNLYDFEEAFKGLDSKEEARTYIDEVNQQFK